MSESLTASEAARKEAAKTIAQLEREVAEMLLESILSEPDARKRTELVGQYQSFMVAASTTSNWR